MHDISRIVSLIHLNGWLKILKKAPDDELEYFPILFVGATFDLEMEGKRAIEADYAKQYGKECNLFDFNECSFKIGEYVGEIFIKIAYKMMERSGIL